MKYQQEMAYATYLEVEKAPVTQSLSPMLAALIEQTNTQILVNAFIERERCIYASWSKRTPMQFKLQAMPKMRRTVSISVCAYCGEAGCDWEPRTVIEMEVDG